MLIVKMKCSFKCCVIAAFMQLFLRAPIHHMYMWWRMRLVLLWLILLLLYLTTKARWNQTKPSQMRELSNVCVYLVWRFSVQSPGTTSLVLKDTTVVLFRMSPSDPFPSDSAPILMAKSRTGSPPSRHDEGKATDIRIFGWSWLPLNGLRWAALGAQRLSLPMGNA